MWVKIIAAIALVTIGYAFAGDREPVTQIETHYVDVPRDVPGPTQTVTVTAVSPACQHVIDLAGQLSQSVLDLGAQQGSIKALLERSAAAQYDGNEAEIVQLRTELDDLRVTLLDAYAAAGAQQLDYTTSILECNAS